MEADHTSAFIALEPTARSTEEGCNVEGGAVVLSSQMAGADSSLMMPEASELTVAMCSASGVHVDQQRTNVVATRQESKGARCRTNNVHAMLAEGAPAWCVSHLAGSDAPPPEEHSDEVVLSEAEVKELTERFIFGHPSGPKATGPSRAASHPTLRLIVTADKVRTSLWPSRRPEIKALFADEQGRFDKQELLAHIANNTLGRPILFTTDARSVGTACKNALAKERRETAAVKKTADAAVTTARAAAAKDACLLGTVAAAEAARKTALAAVLEQVYDLKLPNSTVGGK